METLTWLPAESTNDVAANGVPSFGFISSDNSVAELKEPVPGYSLYMIFEPCRITMLA
jgi:hypothetical protein